MLEELEDIEVDKKKEKMKIRNNVNIGLTSFSCFLSQRDFPTNARIIYSTVQVTEKTKPGGVSEDFTIELYQSMLVLVI